MDKICDYIGKNNNSIFKEMIMIACVCAGCSDAIIELKKSGAPQRWLKLPDDLRGSSFSCFVLIPEVTCVAGGVGLCAGAQVVVSY